MQCDVCGKKKATVHLTEIVDEQMSEMHLCEDCAKEKSVQMEQQFGLADLLAGLADFSKQVKDVDEVSIKCANCGLNYDEFRKLGRLGCSECYNAFHDQLAVLLKKIHGSNKHLGKTPHHPEGVQPIAAVSLDHLKEALQRAILEEDFEKAAEIRDKIRQLEQKGNA